MTQETLKPLQPGDPAPDFTLSTVQADGTVSLANYRGKSGLLLGLFRGLYCPFCRRAIAQMAASSEKLKPLGIQSLAVVATDLANARLYYKFRPTPLPLAVDPELATHRSYGVPRPEPTPQLMQEMATVRINPTGELQQPMHIEQVSAALARIDGYEKTETDKSDEAQQFTQLKGQFFIDPGGVIRWANIECAREGLAGLGKFPTSEELVAAGRMSMLHST
jgi:peroxiredoxin